MSSTHAHRLAALARSVILDAHEALAANPTVHDDTPLCIVACELADAQFLVADLRALADAVRQGLTPVEAA